MFVSISLSPSFSFFLPVVLMQSDFSCILKISGGMVKGGSTKATFIEELCMLIPVIINTTGQQ